MNKKILGPISLVLLLLCMNLLTLSSLIIGEGFDLIITDPENDVEDMETGKVQGYEHLDIVELKSSENLLETQVILELTVKGIITDSDSITYSIEIMDGEEMIYGIFYTNGVGMGSNYDDGSSDVLQASGSGTSTLEVTVQKIDLGEISDFDMRASSMEYSESSKQFLVDWAPDMEMYDDIPFYDLPIMITEPKPNSTAFGTKMIEGICAPSLNMESVEIQFDSMQDNEWKAVTSLDNWETWEYSWDTTKFSDEKHTINVRGFNGSEYFYDSIFVFIDQSCAQSPHTTDVPVLKMGLELHYTLKIGEMFGGDLSGENYEMTSSMVMKVIKKEKIMIEGMEYEVYNIQIRTEMNMTMSYDDEVFTSSSTGLGNQWIRIEDLATVKSIMKSTSSFSGMHETSEVESTYDPLMDSYNFPIRVAETWTSSFTESIEETMKFGDEGDKYSESYDAIVICEALNFAKIEVPAGSFDSFAIWSKETSGEYYGRGSPFGSTMDGYTVNYYSPKLGFPVKSEHYYNNRELYMSMELTSYSENEVIGDNDSESKGDVLPFYLLLVPVIAALVIAAALVVRKKRKKESDMAVGGSHLADTVSQNQTELLTSLGYPQSSQGQSISVPHQSVSQPPQHSYSPPPPPPQIQRNQSTKARIPIPSQRAEPIKNIKCPRCFKSFSVQSTSINVQCPFCGVKGKL
jgi:hypothetical protein